MFGQTTIDCGLTGIATIGLHGCTGRLSLGSAMIVRRRHLLIRRTMRAPGVAGGSHGTGLNAQADPQCDNHAEYTAFCRASRVLHVVQETHFFKSTPVLSRIELHGISVYT